MAFYEMTDLANDEELKTEHMGAFTIQTWYVFMFYSACSGRPKFFLSRISILFWVNGSNGHNWFNLAHAIESDWIV